MIILKRKRKYIVLIIIFVVIVALLAVGFNYYKNIDKDKNIEYNNYTIYKETTGKIEKYNASNTVDAYMGGDNAYYITGKISSKENKKFIVITYNLYDKSNKKIGTAIAGLNELKSNKKYKYKAIAIIKNSKIIDIEHYKFKDIKES